MLTPRLTIRVSATLAAGGVALVLLQGGGIINNGDYWKDNVTAVTLLDIVAFLAICATHSIGGSPGLPVRPLHLYLVVIVLTTTLGAAGFFVLESYYPRVSRPDLKGGVTLQLAGVLFTTLAWAIARRKARSPRQSLLCLQWDDKRAKYFTVGLFSVVAAGNVVGFARLGFIPVLESGAGIEFLRSGTAASMGGLDKFIKLAPLVTMIAGSVLIEGRRGKEAWPVYIPVFIASLAITAASTARILFLLPIGTLSLLYVWRKGARPFRVALATALVGGVSVVASMLVWWSRTGDNAVALLPGYLSFFQSSPWVEFADYARLVEKVDHGGPLGGGRWLAQFAMPLLPSGAWELLGVDKRSEMLATTYQLWSYIGGEAQMLRTGSMGEFYMYWGSIGVWLWAGTIGFLLALIERIAESAMASDGRLLLVALCSTVVCLLPILQVYVFTDMLFFYGSLVFAIQLLVATRRPRGGRAAGPDVKLTPGPNRRGKQRVGVATGPHTTTPR